MLQYQWKFDEKFKFSRARSRSDLPQTWQRLMSTTWVKLLTKEKSLRSPISRKADLPPLKPMVKEARQSNFNNQHQNGSLSVGWLIADCDLWIHSMEHAHYTRSTKHSFTVVICSRHDLHSPLRYKYEYCRFSTPMLIKCKHSTCLWTISEFRSEVPSYPELLCSLYPHQSYLFRCLVPS